MLNVSTNPLRQWGFQQCLSFSWTTLRGKHCHHPIAVMGVVDTFGPRVVRPSDPRTQRITLKIVGFDVTRLDLQLPPFTQSLTSLLNNAMHNTVVV